MPRNKNKPLFELTHEEIARFWSLIKIGEPDECWPWRVGTKHATFWIRRRKILSHRISHFLNTGNDPGELVVCHSCDNPPCCNPKHLHTGRQGDNVREASSRNRLLTGERNAFSRRIEERSGENHWARKCPERVRRGDSHSMAILTSDKVLLIRKEHANGEKPKSLAEKYGISRSNVEMIVTRKTWRHI